MPSVMLDASTIHRSRIWVAMFVALSCGGGLGVLGKVGLLHRLPSAAHVLVLFLVFGWILSGLLWRRAIQFHRLLTPVVLLGMLICPLLILPRAERMHAEGRGTDQPSCVISASASMAHGQWPYDASRMWSRNPLSCGPGWVALQMPFVQTIGYSWTVLLAIAGSLATLAVCAGLERTSQLLSLLALAPGFWVAAADGSDFLPFGLITLAILVAASSRRRALPLLVLLLGLVAQFRAATVLLPATLARRIGNRASWAASIIAIGVQACFLFYNPARFTREGPMHLFSKLTGGDVPLATPLYLALAYVALALLATYVVQVLARSIRPDSLLLGYLLCIFALPAALNLAINLQHHGITLDALGFWEGGNWLVGCLPAAAYLLLDRPGREAMATSHAELALEPANQ